MLPSSAPPWPSAKAGKPTSVPPKPSRGRRRGRSSVTTPRDASAPRIDACLSASGRQARTGSASAIEQRADASRRRRNAEREHRRRGRGQQGDEQRPDDEGDLLQRCLERVRGGAQFGIGEHPRPERAQRGPDRRHQAAGRSCGQADERQRRVDERQHAHADQQRRKDQRAREENPGLPATVDAAPGDRSADRRGDEVGPRRRHRRPRSSHRSRGREAAAPARSSPQAGAPASR